MASRDTLLQAHSLVMDGDTISYFTAGRSAGITFVLIHGLGVSSKYFKGLIMALAENFRVVSIDLPGFGDSSRSDKTWTMDDFAVAAHGVIAQEHIVHPILVGQSMGCQVVASLLAQYPDLSAKAILIAPTVESKKRTMLSQTCKLIEDWLYEPPLVNIRVWREYTRCGPRQYLKTLRPMLKDRIEENLASSQAAVMIIRGSHDVIVPHAWAGKLAAITTVAGICEIKGAPHLVHMTNTEEVANICEGFALA
jgi:pimeloyl-ACP methyl ester carboxylesterase